jgi:hypothetical protein
MTSTLNLTAPGGERPWLARNWKWVIPVGCLSVFVLLGAFVGGILLIVEASFKNSDAYTQALARAQAHPLVREEMGEPVNPGWFVSGNIHTSGASGDADISIPISGPKGKGTLYVVAKKSAGQWKLEVLQVEVDGKPERIDLVEAEQETPVEE